MDRSGQGRRRSLRYLLVGEALEGRQLLSGATAELTHRQLLKELYTPTGFPAVRPNTPVLPFGTTSKWATFIDPSSRISNGNNVIVGTRSFVGFYTTLNASHGHIKIGGATSIENNATVVANPSKKTPWTNVFIGDNVVVGYGAKVLGPSTIGSYSTTAPVTSIGYGAVIDGATIQAGAYVGDLARVGPGVTLPAGYYVLPGTNVTTNVEASNPALGKVRLVTATDISSATTRLNQDLALANGYTSLYQGNPATGVNLGVGVNVTGVYNGDLAAVSGSSMEPGSTNVSFEPSNTLPSSQPRFPAPRRAKVPTLIYFLPLRITGGVAFADTVKNTIAASGRGDTIAGDIGQPINIGSLGKLGNDVAIASAVGSTISIGSNFQAGTSAVIYGSSGKKNTIGDNVSIGAGSVVVGSTLGSGTIVGAHTVVINSTFPAGSVLAPNSYYDNGVLVRPVEW